MSCTMQIFCNKFNLKGIGERPKMASVYREDNI